MAGFADVSDSLLAGHGAVVVGGSRGIGREVARLIAALGAGVVVNGRDEAAVTETVSAITAGRDAADRVRRIADRRADRRGADHVVRRRLWPHRHPDELRRHPRTTGSSILTITGDEFRNVLDSHLGTTFHTCRAAAPRMVDQGHGAIVNTSSFAFLGDYGGTGYPAGKGAVNGLTMAIAAELNEYGVRANVVCPGAKTRISTGPDYEEQIRSLNRRGLLDDATAQGSLDAPPPEYVAPLYAYLVSDLAADVTGQILIGAGGFVGRFDKPTPALLGYRDHTDAPPWTLPRTATPMIGAGESADRDRGDGHRAGARGGPVPSVGTDPPGGTSEWVFGAPGLSAPSGKLQSSISLIFVPGGTTLCWDTVHWASGRSSPIEPPKMGLMPSDLRIATALP